MLVLFQIVPPLSFLIREQTVATVINLYSVAVGWNSFDMSAAYVVPSS